MPDKPKNGKDNLDLDALIDSAELEELRKRYTLSNDEDAGSKKSETASPPSQEEKNNATQADAPLSRAPGEAQTQEVFEDENFEDLMSSFRVIYEEADRSLEQSHNQIINSPSSASEPSHTPEQNKTDRNYSAGMRIVYEEPEKSFPHQNKRAEAIVEPPLFSAEKTHQNPPADIYFSSHKTTTAGADLLEDIGDNAPVKETAFKRFAKNTFPHKGDKFSEILRKTILNIAILTMLVCGGILLNIYVVAPYLNNREAQKTNQLKADDKLFAAWANARDKYPDVDFPTGMQLKFVELFVTNKDFSGWLSIPGTEVELPVVQGADNTEYLKKSFYGEKSKYGCCFLDSSNRIDELDRNTVIYGHNMKSDNMMLGPLEDYKTIDGFKAAPLISFSTLYKDTKWKIYAVFISNGAESGDDGYLFNYIFRNLSSDDAFGSYINQIDQRKLYTTGVDILPDDKILTVSTCIYDFKDARLAVVARMVREGESEEVDLSKIAPIKSPRYPQAWYSAKGQPNPYKNAENWFPN